MWWTWRGLSLFFVTTVTLSTGVDGLDDNSIENYDYDDLLNYLLIYPGTKWCGAGNIATDDDELGSHQQTDSCCRAHDMCPDIIEAGQSKHGLTNHAPYTRLHCDCDDEFLKCLRSSADDMKVSKIVGTLYFDLLNQKCFKSEQKIAGCAEYNSIKMKCENYTLDPSSDKRWQWFDVPPFNNP